MNLASFPWANLISLARLCFVPWVLVLLMSGAYCTAFFVIAVSAASDLLDGYVARYLNQISSLGTILDPLADKLLVVSVVTFFVVQQALPLWFVLAIFFRDISLLTGMFALLFFHKRAIVPSLLLGKISTGWNLLLLMSLCLNDMAPGLIFLQRPLFYMSAIFVVLSFLHYSKRWFSLFLEPTL